MLALIFVVGAMFADPVWVVDKTTSSLDGRSHYIAMIESTNRIASPGSEQRPGLLALGCVGRLRISFSSPSVIQGSSVDVTWKIGEGPVGRANAEVARRRRRLGYSNVGTAAV